MDQRIGYVDDRGYLFCAICRPFETMCADQTEAVYGTPTYGEDVCDGCHRTMSEVPAELAEMAS